MQGPRGDMNQKMRLTVVIAPQQGSVPQVLATRRGLWAACILDRQRNLHFDAANYRLFDFNTQLRAPSWEAVVTLAGYWCLNNFELLFDISRDHRPNRQVDETFRGPPEEKCQRVSRIDRMRLLGLLLWDGPPRRSSAVARSRSASFPRGLLLRLAPTLERAEEAPRGALFPRTGARGWRQRPCDRH